jgi:hypothetical protein
MTNKQGFYYIIVQPSASAFWQCRAMANAEAVGVAMANLTICTGMPTLFLMSLYTTNKLFNEKQRRFSLYHCTIFDISILVMLSYGRCRCRGHGRARGLHGHTYPILYVSIYHQ